MMITKHRKGIKISANFWEYEFACRCGHPKCRDKARLTAAQLGAYKDLCIHLETLRSYLAKITESVSVPIKVISGVRCPRHEIYKKGSMHSAIHKREDGVLIVAADIKVFKKYEPKWMDLDGKYLAGVVHTMIKTNRMGEGGVGTYDYHARTLHIDNRGTKARWRHRKDK